MNKDEMLKMLLDNLAENGNLDFKWDFQPDNDYSAYIITSGEGVFILTIQDAKIEVIE